MTEAHEVYRLQPEFAKRELLTIEHAKLEYDHHKQHLPDTTARRLVSAGGLMCSHGSTMGMRLNFKSRDRKPHFFHKCMEKSKNCGADSKVHCPCGLQRNKDHTFAQRALVEYINSGRILTVSCFCTTGNHEVVAYKSCVGTQATAEGRLYESLKARGDVVLRSLGANTMVLEVLHSHVTKPETRIGVRYLEIYASEVLAYLKTGHMRCEQPKTKDSQPVCQQCVVEIQQRKARMLQNAKEAKERNYIREETIRRQRESQCMEKEDTRLQEIDNKRQNPLTEHKQQKKGYINVNVSKCQSVERSECRRLGQDLAEPRKMHKRQKRLHKAELSKHERQAKMKSSNDWHKDTLSQSNKNQTRIHTLFARQQ